MSQQKEIGTLVVVVLKAQHLHQPSFYKQDPYAQAYFSGLKKRTKVNQKGGQHPVWDDELRFPVFADAGKDKVNRILEISCYKEEQRGDDVLLGKGTVDIEETLKTGEFDDWIPLETSAGARGEVYLEMTFYANSPPPSTRRPSKIVPSDRLARPAAHLTSSFPQPWRVAGKPGQLPQASASQIPSTLIPARASQCTPGEIASNCIITPVVAVKSKDDSLPPLPVNNATPNIGSRKNLEHPASLHPGERSGSKATLPQNWNRVTSTGRPLPGALPDQLSRRTLSDTPLLAPPLFSQLQDSFSTYSPGITSITGARGGSTPSVAMNDRADEYPPLAFRIPLPSSPGPPQRESWNAYTTGGDYGPSGQVYVQPNSHAYLPAPTQGHPQTSPSPRPMSFHTLPGQSLKPYESPAIASPPPLNQHYPIEPPMSLSLSPILQTHSAQPQQQQVSYLPQPQHAIHQKPFLPPPELQQSDPQRIVYTQTPQPNVPQLFQQHSHPDLTPNNHSAAAASQLPQPLYSQTPQQSSFAVPPPPPPLQPPPQPPHQTHFSPPPPPPPLFYSPGEQGTFLTVSVPQVSQTPISQSASSQEPIPSPTSMSLPQSVNPLHLLRSSIITPPQAVSGIEENSMQGRIEQGKNTAELVTVIKDGTIPLEELSETLGNVIRNQESEELSKKAIKDGEGEDEGQSREEELKRQEDTQRKRQEEARGEEQRKRESEEWRKREADVLRREEECRKWEEERRRQEEEERRRKEEECMRREEEERRKQEEHRRQEELRIQREYEEAERRRKASEEDARRRRAEEAEAERRWQEELARIRARAEQEAADAAFARAQMEAEEVERRRQEEADLALVRQVQEEAEREERLAQERRRQEEADMEVARREQAHEEELERRRVEERRHRTEVADRELARRLEMELNVGTEYGGGDASQQRRAAGSRQH